MNLSEPIGIVAMITLMCVLIMESYLWRLNRRKPDSEGKKTENLLKKKTEAEAVASNQKETENNSDRLRDFSGGVMGIE